MNHAHMDQKHPGAGASSAGLATIERWLTGPRFSGLPAREAGNPVPALSFEFFPPRTEALETQLWSAIRRLEPLRPRFVSVTYGAGGSTQARTHATVARVAGETSLVAAAHLTCVGATREQVDEVARGYWAAGVRHIVALRGDAPPGAAYEPHPGGYAYAADLVAGLKRVADFEISVAAYPETHPAALSPGDDLDALKRKLDAGATRAITQYFFDSAVFLRFLDRCLAAGITAPVVPGIMPVSNFSQAARFSAMCGTSVPDWLGHLFDGLDDDPDTRRMVGAIQAAELVRLLQANGIDEFHFYTLNRPDLTYAIAHILGVRRAPVWRPERTLLYPYRGPDTPSAPNDYLSRLNQEQRDAVEALDGPLLVLAGAGTGKTRVLTTRFAHILLTQRAMPSQVLAVTFTNKAAREMRERVGAMLGRPAEGLWLGTFHALCARMLRRHADLVGLTSGFTILDADDQMRLLKQIMEANRIDAKRWPPQALMAQLQRWKDRGLTPERVGPNDDTDFANGRATELYAAYQARLRALNTADFGDLLLYMTELLRTREEVLAQYHRMFRYVLVDEYQDTNVVQYLWLRLLAQSHKNICCVGDDDQSIYSWRGAEVENILRFEKDFPGARIVRLEANYRSTAPILAAASGLIAHNEGRLGKTLRPGRADAGGDPVQVLSFWDSDEEGRMVGDRIAQLSQAGNSLAEMAILVRAGFQTRAFEERLIVLGIPYRVVGGLRFYERAEIRDAIAYMRVLHQPSDDLAFERIINVPRRGVGEVALRAMHEAARAQEIPLAAAAASLLASGGLKGRVRDAVATLLQGFARWREMAGRDGHVLALATMLDESGYTAMWQQDKSPEAPGRLDNLKELVRALSDFETMGGFLDHVSLVMENEENAAGDRVSLMTLHGAKGLEFDTVFLPGWEEGVFPNQRSMDESGNKGLEEERRLAYVGLTRARRRAFVSHAANRRIYANWQTSIPSRFIDELPEAHVEHSGSQAMARDARIAAPPIFAGQFPMVARRPRTTEVWEQAARPPRADPMVVGGRVFHQKFGYGTVTHVDDDRLDIDFETSGHKRVLDRFVEKA